MWLLHLPNSHSSRPKRCIHKGSSLVIHFYILLIPVKTKAGASFSFEHLLLSSDRNMTQVYWHKLLEIVTRSMKSSTIIQAQKVVVRRTNTLNYRKSRPFVCISRVKFLKGWRVQYSKLYSRIACQAFYLLMLQSQLMTTNLFLPTTKYFTYL